jgi:hypothetical protein
VKKWDFVRIKKEMSRQHWYSTDLFLIEKVNHHRKLYNFGTDIELINLSTGERISLFDSYIEKLSKEEKTEVKLSLILD